MSTSSSGDKSQVLPIDLTGLTVPAALIARVPAAVAYDYRIIPVRMENKVLSIAVTDAGFNDEFLCDDLHFQLKFDRVIPILTTTESIDAALRRYYPDGRGNDGFGVLL